jgi:hypothetical protein
VALLSIQWYPLLRRFVCSAFFKLTLLVGGDLKDPISCHVLKIVPPFLGVIGFTIAQEIVSPDSKAPGCPGMSHGPAHRSVEGCIRLTPGTDLDAGATAGATLIAYPHARTLFYVEGPFFVAVVHHLITITYGATGALSGALLTLGTEILETEIDGHVR